MQRKPQPRFASGLGRNTRGEFEGRKRLQTMRFTYINISTGKMTWVSIICGGGGGEKGDITVHACCLWSSIRVKETMFKYRKHDGVLLCKGVRDDDLSYDKRADL